MNPSLKRAWLNAIQALRHLPLQAKVDATHALADAFARSVISPELKKHSAHFSFHEVQYPDAEYVPRATTGRFRESIRIGDDINEIAQAEYAPRMPFYHYLQAQVPNTYGPWSGSAYKQGMIDAVPYGGFRFTYKGAQYDVTPGLVHVCLDLWPDTADPDVLAYLEVITPIWKQIQQLPREVDPWSP